MAAGLGAAALIQLCLQECRRLDRGPAAVVHWLQDGEENHVDATCLLTEATVILKTKHRFRWYEYRVVLSPSFRPAWFITEGTMGSQEFLVLYTHQKTKKSKVWQDGVLKISPLGSKAILCDDKGQCLESLFLKCLEVKPGDELESDRYLITIEEVQVVGSTAPKQKAVPEAPASAPGRLTSCGRSLGCQPAGLKRKPTGFQGPRQVAKKVTVIESVKLIPSLETGRSGPASLSPLCSMSALFATTGDRDAQSMPACPEVSVAYKNTERSGMPFPSVVSHPRFKTSPETLREDGDCPRPVSTVSPHSDSLSSNKATTKDFLASRGLGVTQSIRSKAQIVALLKSKPVGMCKELNSRIPEVFPQIYPQASLNIPAESELSGEWGEQTEAKSTESPRSHQPGSGMGARSRWAAYLPSRRSPVDDFTESGGDAESRPQAREGDTVAFKLEGAWGEKRAQLFETCTQEGSRYIGGMPECKIDHSEVQEVEIPSFRGANDLPIVYSSEESNSLLAEPDIQGKTEIPTHQNVQMCVTESVLTREDAQGPVSGTPEKEHQQPGLCPPEPAPLQTESPLSSSQVSDDIVGVLSKSCTGIEDQESAPEPGDSGAQPLVEVTFDLNMFETSDTEESQESGEASQGSEGGPGASWAIGGNAGVHRRGEDMICEEVGRGCEPLLPSVGDKPAEPLLSQFCDDIYAGFDTGPRKARAASGDTEEEHREKRNHLDSSSEWPEDAYAENQEEALGRSTPKDAADADSTPLPSTSARLDAGLQHRPHYLNTPPHQTPENDPLSEQTQPQPFILGNRLGKNEQIFPWTSSHEDGIQLLSPRQCTALDQSHAPVSSSLFYPLEGRHPLSKHTEALTPEPGDRERTRSLPQDHLEVESSGDKQSSSSPRRSPEHSGWENSISLLKSLSEPTTALEGLEIMKRKKNAFQQQQIVQTYKPESGPQARKPLTTVLPEAVPQSQLSQESQEMVKENEAESRGPHPSLQVFLGSEGRPAFWTEIPKQVARKPCDPQLVDFHGHRVKGSASSAVMTRQPHFPLEGCQLPRGVGGEDCSSEMCFLSSQMPGTSPVTNFLQFPDKENFPRGDTTFQIEDNFQAVSKSDTHSVENNLIRESSCLVNQNPQRLLLANPPRRPLVTLPPAEGPLAEGPADIAPCSHSMACDFEFQAASAAPTLGLCEEPAPLVFSTRPEHPCEEPFSQESRGAALADVSRLHRSSTGSKWLKYQSATPGSLTAVDRLGGVGAPGSQPGEWPCIPGHRQGEAANRSLPDSVPLQLIRDKLGHQQQACGSPDPIPRRKFPKVLEQSTGARGLQEVNGAALCFPSGQDIQSVCLPQRQVHIPAEFRSPEHYKQVFTSCLIEHLNILLFELAQRLHRALARVDISFYTSAKERPGTGEHTGPSCHHQQPAKLVAVRKEGPNKGRLFYTCDAPKADRCQFFKWLEAVTPGPSMQGQSLPSRVLSDIKSIGLYLRSQKIPVYEECQLLIRKGFDIQRKQYSKLKKFAAANPDFYNEPKSRLYLKLSRKESSSIYSKDDLWVVSKTLDFELDTFIACSAFFGPSSANEVEIVPLRGYFPSNWPLNTVVHALLVCNASTELTTLKNIQDHFSPATLPITQHLLTMTSSAVSNTRTEKRRFIPPASSKLNRKYELLSLEPTLQLARDFIQAHRLNEDQARALGQVAHMMASHSSANEMQRPLAPPLPITIIHGVFGAGKSYLLAVVILFFVQLFEKSETPTAENARPWKLLISSSTNVAVDRVLLGLLSLGFEKFIRVGSVRKIARPVLPYSLHAGSENETEQLRELHALMKEDLTPVERECVRRSIEQHRRGTNRALLQQVRVVGVTCAACSFPCLNELRFPVVVLDECSQITEPAALLPIARFECEKLVLVGDPKQLPPTIQGSDAAHQSGLEQTLFDRLCLMGHQPVLLRTQYRCHPAISALANDLFYEGSLLDGVRAAERGPLLSWLPTLCFYNVKGLEQIERDNSFHNVAEAAFTLKLIRSLLASGVSGAVIGVITLYKSQMYKLCHLLAGAATELPDTKAVQVSTVDAFQGAEKEVVILSCVRTRQVGFIDSEKRMNVALTRGRRHLLIVGSLACLQKNRLWARVIQHCAGREDGLQHASQCEPQLDHVLRAYCEKQAEEKKKKKKDTVS